MTSVPDIGRGRTHNPAICSPVPYLWTATQRSGVQCLPLDRDPAIWSPVPYLWTATQRSGVQCRTSGPRPVPTSGPRPSDLESSALRLDRDPAIWSPVPTSGPRPSDLQSSALSLDHDPAICSSALPLDHNQLNISLIYTTKISTYHREIHTIPHPIYHPHPPYSTTPKKCIY